jgi:hypothetical protein
MPFPWVYANPPQVPSDIPAIAPRPTLQGFLVGADTRSSKVSYLVLTNYSEGNSARYFDLKSKGMKKVNPISVEWLSHIATVGLPISLPNYPYGDEAEKWIDYAKSVAKRLRLKIVQGIYIIPKSTTSDTASSALQAAN